MNTSVQVSSIVYLYIKLFTVLKNERERTSYFYWTSMYFWVFGRLWWVLCGILRNATFSFISWRCQKSTQLFWTNFFKPRLVRLISQKNKRRNIFDNKLDQNLVMRLLNLQIKLNFWVIEPTWKISEGNKYVNIEHY